MPDYKYSRPVRMDSPECLRLLSIVRRLEAQGAAADAIDRAYEQYWEQSDRDRREAQRLNRIHEEWLSAQAEESRERN